MENQEITRRKIFLGFEWKFNFDQARFSNFFQQNVLSLTSFFCFIEFCVIDEIMFYDQIKEVCHQFLVGAS